MVWIREENGMKQTAMENTRMGTRENTKQGKTQKKMDGPSNNDGHTEEDTGNRDMWGHLVCCTEERSWGEWLGGREDGRMGECTTDRTRQAMDRN